MILRARKVTGNRINSELSFWKFTKFVPYNYDGKLALVGDAIYEDGRSGKRTVLEYELLNSMKPIQSELLTVKRYGKEFRADGKTPNNAWGLNLGKNIRQFDGKNVKIEMNEFGWLLVSEATDEEFAIYGSKKKTSVDEPTMGCRDSSNYYVKLPICMYNILFKLGFALLRLHENGGIELRPGRKKDIGKYSMWHNLMESAKANFSRNNILFGHWMRVTDVGSGIRIPIAFAEKHHLNEVGLKLVVTRKDSKKDVFLLSTPACLCDDCGSIIGELHKKHEEDRHAECVRKAEKKAAAAAAKKKVITWSFDGISREINHEIFRVCAKMEKYNDSPEYVRKLIITVLRQVSEHGLMKDTKEDTIRAVQNYWRKQGKSESTIKMYTDVLNRIYDDIA